MPYPDPATAAAFRAVNSQLVPPPSEANVLFNHRALAVNRPVAEYLAIAIACRAQVLNMMPRGHTKAAWRAALLNMLLGYYQWDPANQDGHYELVAQDPAVVPDEPPQDPDPEEDQEEQ